MMQSRGLALSLLASIWLMGCSSWTQEERPSNEERDLAVLKQEVQRLNREIEFLHQQVTSQQNRAEITSATPFETSYNPLRFQGLERKILAMENCLESLGKEVRSLQGGNQEALSLIRKVQQESLHSLEKRVADLGKMRGDVQQLVRALEPDHPATESSQSAIRVRAGDTLEKIARAHGVTVESLRRANRLKGDRIQVGQTLHLP